MGNKRNIWIDTDPGIDDSVAIALAVAHRDRFNIHGISTVAGNQTSDRVTLNALKVTELLGAPEIPVARGARGPLLREVVPAGDIHGKSGLGYCELPAPQRQPVSENAVPFLWDTIMGLPAGERMTLVPIGPLTNIALLLKTFPEVLGRIEEIVLMGGAAVGGNVTPTAEFNIWEDPEAAKIVFRAGLPIVMCGLDVTLKGGLNRAQVAELRASGGRVARAYGEMLTFYFDSPAYRGSDLVCVHDANTILYLLHPEWYSGKRRTVDVDCSEGMNRGMTVCDQRRQAEEGSVLVLDGQDPALFQRAVMEALTGYDGVPGV